jgi:hypothetical protein
MTEENFEKIAHLETKHDVNFNDDINSIEYLLYLTSNNNITLDDIDILDDSSIIGFSHTPIISLGDRYENPYDDEYYFEIIDVDSEKEIALLKLCKKT